MLTEILAIYGAVIASITPFVAWLAYRKDNPKISGMMTTTVSGRTDSSFKATMCIRIYNRGKAPITIEDAYAHYLPGLIRYPWRSRRWVKIPSAVDLELPFLIEVNSNFKKKIIGNLAISEKDKFGTVLFYAVFKSGEKIKLRSRTQTNWIPDL
jgi:hypothetical protein